MDDKEQIVRLILDLMFKQRITVVDILKVTMKGHSIERMNKTFDLMVKKIAEE